MKRILLSDPDEQSFMLLGPRQTGKSTFLRSLLKPNDLYIDLLPTQTHLLYEKDPGRFRQELLYHYNRYGPFFCAVDEIQKLPGLLDDVHSLRESTKIRFGVTGSIVEKLSTSGINLLAGKLFLKYLFPLVYTEIGDDFSLDRALAYGTLPKVWDNSFSSENDVCSFLQSYTDGYIREGRRPKDRARKFSRFLDLASHNDGELVNMSAMGRECGVSPKTLEAYYQILEDTLLVHRIDGFARSVRRQLIQRPKYIFFDVGVSRALSSRVRVPLTSTERGRCFEQFFTLQLLAFSSYLHKNIQLFYWRDRTGHEVDLLLCRGLEPIAALECKSQGAKGALKGLKAFHQDFPDVPRYVIGSEGLPRELAEGIVYYPWDKFLGEILPEL